MSVFDIYREIIHDNIEYAHLQANHKYDRDRIDEIADLMLETVCTSRHDYPAPLKHGDTLDRIHLEFNLDMPKDFTGHSLSVSDVVVMNRDGKETAFYVDSTGFKELPGFVAVKEPIREAPAAAVDLKVVADYLQKQHHYWTACHQHRGSANLIRYRTGWRYDTTTRGGLGLCPVPREGKFGTTKKLQQGVTADFCELNQPNENSPQLPFEE